jgi:Spy/CpxP family protein refolding chaperone
MKTPPFLLIGCPVLVVIGAIIYFVTFRELHRTSFHAALVEAEMPAGGHMREILSHLDLTNTQQQQVEQIRKTVSDRPQRRHAIYNILTPEQRAKWQQLRAEQQRGAAPALSTNAP